jgi:hypothetical protein
LAAHPDVMAQEANIAAINKRFINNLQICLTVLWAQRNGLCVMASVEFWIVQRQAGKYP